MVSPPPSEDYVRMYYDHQYDRMGKLESQRLTLTHIVITVTVVAFTFGFGDANGIGVSP